ncbi:MAG: tyrosine-type recombinase/integrase [Evtepia sp.]
MLCVKCQATISNDSIFCNVCGKKQVVQRRAGIKSRGNGQGTVYKLKSGKWRAAKTLGYYTDDQNKKHRVVVTNSKLMTKKDALKWLAEDAEKTTQRKDITYKALYDLWLPTHRAGKDTMNCYKAAMNYFKPIWFSKVADIGVDDLQECLDECPKGKRTRQNMKAVCGLVYKYGIPRRCVAGNLNFAQYLIVTGQNAISKQALEQVDVDKIKAQIGITDGADYVYAQIYLGFRPSEFLDLDAMRYNRKERAFIGGAKTEAGTDRIVTISPKILPIVENLVHDKISGAVFCNPDGSKMSIRDYRQLFYNVLDAAAIYNPIENTNGVNVHRFTPHSCRHTFATLLKRVGGADKDKLELIGHTSEEMLRYYQDVSLDDLRKITDLI